jgi:hypothetical protein
MNDETPEVVTENSVTYVTTTEDGNSTETTIKLTPEQAKELIDKDQPK